jgi:hypothetical protein
MREQEYAFPVAIREVDFYEPGKRIAVTHRDKYACSGLVTEVVIGKHTAMIKMVVDCREL